MGIEAVKAYFQKFGISDQVREFDTSSATVELAAAALGVEPARIAKTLAFRLDAACLLVVAAGDVKIDNAAFRREFGTKARMLGFDEVPQLTGHPVGGVCPFALPENTPVFLDVSLQRFETVFPACGTANSAIELSCAQLEQYAHAVRWVNVCKSHKEL